MTTITARLHLLFPYTLAYAYLREGSEILCEGLHEMELDARIPATHIELAKMVMLDCEPIDDLPDCAWRVSWVPEPGGFYPSFEGRFSAREDERDGTTILELTGSYKPPLGAAGEAFDWFLGRTLTTDTVHNFLADVAAEIKARHAIEIAREVFHPGG